MLQWKKNGKVKIGIQDKLQEAIGTFGEKTGGSVTSTTSGYLYTVNYDLDNLYAKKKEVFHYVTSKLLYITKLGGGYLEHAPYLLTTRV